MRKDIRQACYTFQSEDIDSSSDEGIKSEKLEGSIEFVNVSFRYPARPEVKVCLYII